MVGSDRLNVPAIDNWSGGRGGQPPLLRWGTANLILPCPPAVDSHLSTAGGLSQKRNLQNYKTEPTAR